MPSSKQRGFTLIEVLLSAVILFMFLALAAQAFSQSANASLKAERAAKVAALVPLLTNTIKDRISQARGPERLNNEGRFMELSYRWQAQLLERKPPARRFDPAEMEVKEYNDRFNLWQVELTVSLGSYRRQWRYEEISWYD